MSAIELKSVCKKYGKNVIFENFSFSIEKGELVSVMGDSGKGKSTLLNMIGLLESPDQGDIYINNEKIPKINSNKATQLQRNIIGYLFQNFALVDNMTVDKNLDIALKYAKAKDNNLAKAEALTKVKLNGKSKSKIFELSGGEQQRVAIARLLLKPCEIILADEPTGSLDVHNRDMVINLLKDLQKQGKTILIVTHDSNVADICQHVITL